MERSEEAVKSGNSIELDKWVGPGHMFKLSFNALVREKTRVREECRNRSWGQEEKFSAVLMFYFVAM